MRVDAIWTVVSTGDTAGRLRALRDGRAAIRLAIGAAGLRTGVLDMLRIGPATTAEVAARGGITDEALLEAFLRVLESSGLVRQREGRWRLSKRAVRAVGDDVVRATYEAFSGYHTSLYRDLDEQLRGDVVRHDVRERGDLIARLSTAFEPFVSEVLTKTVRDRHPMRVLDVGCGAGLQLATMLAAAPTATGIGIDVDTDAAALARQTLTQRGLAERARVETGDVSSMTVDDIGGPVDLVLLANVIYYLPVDERVAFLAHLGSLLTADGALLLITTAAMPSLVSRHFDLLLRAQDGAMELPAIEDLDLQFRSAGLVPRSTQRLAPGEPLFAVLATRQV